MFKCEFSMDNDAFMRGHKRSEIRRILRDVSEKVAGKWDGGNVVDINGNKIGAWSLTED